MITPATFWNATCTGCGIEWDEELLLDTASLPDEVAEDLTDDGWVVIDTKLWCDQCRPDCDCRSDDDCTPGDDIDCTKAPGTPVTGADTVTLTANEAFVIGCHNRCGATLHHHTEHGAFGPAYITREVAADPAQDGMDAVAEAGGWEYDPATRQFRCPRCRFTTEQAMWCDHQANDQCSHCTECLMCAAGLDQPESVIGDRRHGFTHCPHCQTRTTVPAATDPQQPALQ